MSISAAGMTTAVTMCAVEKLRTRLKKKEKIVVKQLGTTPKEKYSRR
jgi:lambda repressor-like predicted transcriptional regulator